jgi:small conductance mechanosensitive channel
MNIDIAAVLSKLGGKVQSWFESFVVMLPNIVAAVVIVLVSALAARGVDKLVRRLSHKVTSGNEAFSNLAAKVCNVATRILGVFIALSVLQLEKTVTSLLAGVGVVGLALGFAFQDIAANFVSGVFMAVRRPFQPGDLVEIAGKLAVVETVELRSTIVTTNDGIWVQVPNKDIFQSPIINYTKTPSRRMDLEVGIAYSDDLEKVREVAVDAVQSIPGRDTERDVDLFFTGFGDSSINFVIRVWLERSMQRDYLNARSEAIIAIKKAFDAASITIPFPIRTLDFGASVVGGERIDQVGLRVLEADSDAA